MTLPPAPTPQPFALRMSDVSVRLGGAVILSHVTCEPIPGKINAIVGPNGAGKTTLLRAILGLVAFTGKIERGTRPDGSAMRIGYVPQRLDFDRAMPLSVLEFLCCALQRRPLWIGKSRAAVQKATTALQRVGAADWTRRPLGRLSGGELQRVLLAMALARDPDILLLDEPVSGVDVAGEELFCDLLGGLQSHSDYTMLLVNHDLSIVTRHAHHVICLNRTIHCEGETVQTLTAENLRRLYGHDVGVFAHTHSHEGHAHGPNPGRTSDCCSSSGHAGKTGQDSPNINAANPEGRNHPC